MLKKEMMALFTREIADIIQAILKKGNTAEVKKENGKIVIVEIQRKVKMKTSMNG